jgi:hypothetical protein
MPQAKPLKFPAFSVNQKFLSSKTSSFATIVRLGKYQTDADVDWLFVSLVLVTVNHVQLNAVLIVSPTLQKNAKDAN